MWRASVSHTDSVTCRYVLYGTPQPGRSRGMQRLAAVLLAGLAVTILSHHVPLSFQQQEDIMVRASPECTNGFPRDFVWGMGTAAYQIEGGVTAMGRQPSIWDIFAHQPGKVFNGDTGDVACNHIERFRSDVALMRSIGLKHYRFSISWSRVMSWNASAARMVPNEAGLRFYDRLLNALTGAGIRPYVTLYHWDLPQALHDHLGGWHRPNNQAIVREFASYAALCFGRYARHVSFWVTFNEPWSFIVEGYDSGKSAPGCVPYQPGPGRCAHGATDVYVVAHNVLNAHAAAVATFRSDYQPTTGGLISMTLNCEASLPATDSAADADAADRAFQFMLGWFLQPLLTGDYPAVMRQLVGERLPRFTPKQASLLIGSIDVLSLNHYSTHLVSDASANHSIPSNVVALYGSTWMDDQQLTLSFASSWFTSASPWLHKYAPGIRLLLNWAAGRAAGRWTGPVFITENGWSCRSETAGAAAVDNEQVAYLSEYIEQVRLAMADDGIDVRGYFAWSLLDNYEWSDGYSKRFGLFFVDYATQERTPKRAALWWNQTRRCEPVMGHASL